MIDKKRLTTFIEFRPSFSKRIRVSMANSGHFPEASFLGVHDSNARALLRHDSRLPSPGQVAQDLPHHLCHVHSLDRRTVLHHGVDGHSRR